MSDWRPFSIANPGRWTAHVYRLGLCSASNLLILSHDRFYLAMVFFSELRTSPLSMAASSSTAPEWLKHCSTSPHIVTVIRVLSQRELERASARNASRLGSHPSRTRRLSHILPLITNRLDIVSHYSVSIGCSPDNKRSNRYADITPYDRTRVVVSSKGVEMGDSNSSDGRYLNANWLRERAGGKWWIAAQAPLPRTAHAFLSVVLQPVIRPHIGKSPTSSPKSSRVRTVVQLTQTFESGMRKADVYFPPEDGQSWVISPEEGCFAPSLKVTLVQLKWITDAKCTQSTVSIEPLSSSHLEPAVFQHMLYGSWPDHGVPSPEDRASLLRFARLVDEVNRDVSSQPEGEDLDPDPPIMVNCSAGVGRTGSFIALSSLLRTHGFLSPPTSPPEESPLIPSPLGPLPGELQDDLVAQEIDMLREQRPGMIQKDDQVIFLYEMLMAAFTESEHSGRLNGTG